MQKINKNWSIYLIMILWVTIAISCKNHNDYESQDFESTIVEASPGANYRSQLNAKSYDRDYLDEIAPIELSHVDDAINTDISDLKDNPNPTQYDKKKIIRDGSMTIKSKNIESSKSRIDSLIKVLHGYYEQDVLENGTNNIRYDIKIRIPSSNFDALIAGVQQGTDEIEYKNITARDVTEEYVDLQSRLASKEAYLKRYREILSKATNIKDILEIERNIRILQEEIESTNGRLKYLGDQVAFSTLNIKLYQPKDFVYNPPQKDNFMQRLIKALDHGWSFMLNVIVGIFTLWPVLIVVGIGLFIYKRKKNKK